MSEQATVFAIERVGKVIVVAPLGDESSFRYFDIPSQANRVMWMLDDRSVLGLVIDLGRVRTLGWVMSSASVRLVRNLDYRGGLAVYCAASQANLAQLSTMKLGDPWTHHGTRDEAVGVIRELLATADAASVEDE